MKLSRHLQPGTGPVAAPLSAEPDSYVERQWVVNEHPLQRSQLRNYETLFSIGNGLVGTRGTFEEGYPGNRPATFAAGVFDRPAGEPVPSLVTLPNWVELRFVVNGEQFRMHEGTLFGFERTLDLRNGTLRRRVLWRSPSGDVLRVSFERFASLANPHVMALSTEIEVLGEGQHLIEVIAALDGTHGAATPRSLDHWSELHAQASHDRLMIHGTTGQSRYRVAMASCLQVETQPMTWNSARRNRRPMHAAFFRAAQYQPVVVRKIVSLHTSRDCRDPESAVLATLQAAAAKGYPALKQEHDLEWGKYWEAAGIEIEGDEVAQRAVRFCTYHLLIAAPRHEQQVSIGAKALSGSGYKGHVFWDSELFMLPLFTVTLPELARRLLAYRHFTLPAARKKAVELSCRGALFPWESTDTGEETTPKWSQPQEESGKRIRIWTGEKEQHIVSDVAYAVIQFWDWSGDDDWFAAQGAEIVLDTAVFWATRVEHNLQAGRYELTEQIGPDEYHENVSNSAFTNRMIVWHMAQARRVWSWLRENRPLDAARLGGALSIDEPLLQKWEDIERTMYVPRVKLEIGEVLEEFSGFFDQLEPLPLERYHPRTDNIDLVIGHDALTRARVVKQADVVMLIALLGNELGDGGFLRRNWDTYYPINDHGSSLSPAVHARVAARLGIEEEAYNLFIRGATLDLDDNKGNVSDGIHAASCGGVWQAVVFGFCGLELTPEGPRIVDPRLPRHWRSVKFNVSYRGRTVPIHVSSQPPS